MHWEVRVHPEVKQWLVGLRGDYKTARAIGAAIEYVASNGPGVGRPLVDSIQGSALPNLKELRPGSSGASEIRILFAFDPARRMLLLVGGDKAGNWRRWYTEAIPVAEARYVEMTKEEA